MIEFFEPNKFEKLKGASPNESSGIELMEQAFS